MAGAKATNLTRFDGNESDIHLNSEAIKGKHKVFEGRQVLEAGCAVLLVQEFENRGSFLTMIQLDISHNNLGPQGAEAIAVAVTKRPSAPLKVLKLSGNEIISKEAGEAIASLLKSSTNLVELDLSDNQNNNLTLNAFAFARELGAGLAENTTLLNLDLKNNMIGQVVLPANWCQNGEQTYTNMAGRVPAVHNHGLPTYWPHQQHQPNGAFQSTGVQLLLEILDKPGSALQSINLLGNCVHDLEAKKLTEIINSDRLNLMSACGMPDCQQHTANFSQVLSGRGPPTGFGLDIHDAKLVAVEIANRGHVPNAITFRGARHPRTGVYKDEAPIVTVHASSARVVVNNFFLGVGGTTLLASYMTRVTGLRVLLLKSNYLHSEGLQALSTMLKIHSGLTEIDISDNLVTKSKLTGHYSNTGLDSLVCALQSNEVLCTLDMSENDLHATHASSSRSQLQAVCSSKALELKM
jgi:hypothetical protein